MRSCWCWRLSVGNVRPRHAAGRIRTAPGWRLPGCGCRTSAGCPWNILIWILQGCRKLAGGWLAQWIAFSRWLCLDAARDSSPDALLAALRVRMHLTKSLPLRLLCSGAGRSDSVGSLGILLRSAFAPVLARILSQQLDHIRVQDRRSASAIPLAERKATLEVPSSTSRDIHCPDTQIVWKNCC